MVFTTPWFLLFSISAGIAYLLFSRYRVNRLIVLTLASIIFYINLTGVTAFAFVVLLATFTFISGIWIANYRGLNKKKLLVLCLSPVVLSLLYFNYFGFINEIMQAGLNAAKVSYTEDSTNLIKSLAPVLRPLGISFFAFEFCHYLVDVYKGQSPIRNPLHFSLFALFFPRLVSGPIIRYQQLVPQFEAGLPPVAKDIILGVQRIAVGFIKKFLIADPAANLASSLFHVDNILTGSDAVWLCLVLYIRIYMDFSAYSDMAIGTARIFGIRLPENFNYPFLATSLSEFWKRWHISLSTWIRDYIYIPLGGGRGSIYKKSFNLLFAMALCGLWHGPAWNFVIWGFAHGVGLQISHMLEFAVEKIKVNIPSHNKNIIKAFETTTLLLGLVLTQFFVALTWLIFFLPVMDVRRILDVLKNSIIRLL